MRDHRISLCLIPILVIILLTSVFPGCGDSDKEPTPTPIPTPTETPAEAPTDTPSPPPAETPTDTPSPPRTEAPTDTPTTVPEESTTLPEEPVPQDEPPTTEDTTPAPEQEFKQINIIYVEGDDPVPDKELWLSYYDEKAQTWVMENELTDNEGMATFSVPEGESAESYQFIFGFSEAEVDRYTLEIDDLKRPALRIPPDTSYKTLTLELDNDYNLSVIEGTAETIWIWSPDDD